MGSVLAVDSVTMSSILIESAGFFKVWKRPQLGLVWSNGGVNLRPRVVSTMLPTHHIVLMREIPSVER